MPSKHWLAMYMILLITVGLMLVFLFIGGPAAVTSIVAVLGLLLTIIEFFYLHIFTASHKPPSGNSTKERSFHAEGRAPSRKFSPIRFTRREEDE